MLEVESWQELLPFLVLKVIYPAVMGFGFVAVMNSKSTL